MNARTGEEGGGLDEEGATEVRNTKDKKKNKDGEELVSRIRELDLSIMNGNVEGDEEGEYTYIGGAGCSIIDFAIVN